MTKTIYYILLLSLIILTPYIIFLGPSKDSIIGSQNYDMRSLIAIMRNFEFTQISRGVFPLWNPYIFSGLPDAAVFQLFYPLNYVHLILPLPFAINFLFIFHHILAAVGMYFYLRHKTSCSLSSFTGALVFSLSSTFILRIFAGHPTIINSIAWMPFLFLTVDYALEKKKGIFVILSGVILALQILGGHVQFVFITIVGLFCYVIYYAWAAYFYQRRTFREISIYFFLFFGVVFLGVVLSAVQLLPLRETMAESLRFLNDANFGASFSMPPENIITMISPGFFGSISRGDFWGKWFPWEVQLYAGILPIFLSLLAVIKKEKQSLFFAGLFLAAIILSLGGYLPGYKYIYTSLIGFRHFRASGRFLILAVFALSVLSGQGVAALQVKDANFSRKIKNIIFAALFLFFLAIALLCFLIAMPSFWWKIVTFLLTYDKLYPATYAPLFYLSHSYRIVINSIIMSSTLLILNIVLFWIFLRGIGTKHFRNIVLISVLLFDLMGFAMRYFAVFPANMCRLDNPAIKFMKERIGLSRCLLLDDNKNGGVMQGLLSIGGYTAAIPGRYNEFLNYTQGRPINIPIVSDSIRISSPLFRLLNLKYIYSPKKIRFNIPGFKKMYSMDGIYVYEADEVLPKAFIAHKAKIIPGRDNILKTLSDDSFNFRETVILEEAVGLTGINSSSIPEPEPVITTYSPNRIVVNANIKADGYLILCDNYYPGWRAYVDARRTRILRANYILRAVPLHPGNHTVEFIYSPASLKIGLFITLSFLALSIVMLIVIIKKGV